MSRVQTVAVLYPGEMGSAIAELLISRGHRVVTFLDGRSTQTAQRSTRLGIEPLTSMVDVASQADFVLSVSSPGHAYQLAVDFAQVARNVSSKPVYVDLNSIGPNLATEIEVAVSSAGLRFVDGAINGLAKNLATTCTLFLSGSSADLVAALFESSMKVKLLGAHAGQASAMKMMLSGLSKGVCALFVECALLGRHHSMLDGMIDAVSTIYPGLFAIVQRMLPTYPEHADRRAEEMRELEATARHAIGEPRMLKAARILHEELVGVDFGEHAERAEWTVKSIIELLADCKIGSESSSEGGAATKNIGNVTTMEMDHG